MCTQDKITHIEKLSNGGKNLHVLINHSVEMYAVLDTKDKRYGEIIASYNDDNSVEYVKSLVQEFLTIVKNVMKNAVDDMKNLNCFQLADKYGAALTPHSNFDYAQSAKYYDLKKGKFSWFLD